MTSKKEIVAKLRSAVDALLSDADEYAPTEEQTVRVVEAVRSVLEDGLEGNRSLRPFIWSVVRRVGRAYPITFHPSIDRVRALGRQEGLDREQLEDTWIKQALHEGVLSSLLTNIIRQFQIRSAYLSEAIICDKLTRQEIKKTLDRLKDVIQAVPDAPSVSSWSSDDSFVHTPRSFETEHRVETSANHLSGRNGGDARLSCGISTHQCRDDVQKQTLSKSHATIPRQNNTSLIESATMTQTKQENKDLSDLEQGIHTVSIGSEITEASTMNNASTAKGKCSDDDLEIKTPERSSFFGRITRNLSGTLYHSLIDPHVKDSPMSELSQEEQTSRFWSRPRAALSTTSSLKREVERDIGAGLSTPVTSDERSKASQLLMKEINKVSRLILKQFCSNGQPLSVDLYPISKILHLYEEALSIGLRPCPLFQPNIPDMYLSDFEKIIPRGNATPHALLIAMQTIYPKDLSGMIVMACDGDHSHHFQQWLKDCLMDRHLGDQMERVLEHQDFLRGWYFPEAIVTNEDLVQALIATCRGLDVISIHGSKKEEDETSEEVPSPFDPSSEQVEGNDTDMAQIEKALSPRTSEKEMDNGNSVDGRESMGNDDDNDQSNCLGIKMKTDDCEQCNIHQRIHSTTHSDQAFEGTNSRQLNNAINEGASSSSHLRTTASLSSAFDYGRSVSSSQELPSFQQRSLSMTHSGRLRSGVSARSSSKGHQHSTSVISACISGEDEEDWRGVWKDVDVVRYELRTTPHGDQFVVYIIEVMANDGTHWQTARRFSDLMALNKSLIKQHVDLPHSWTNVSKARVVAGKRRFSEEIVDARLAMIRQCLWDLMKAFPESMIWTSVSEYLDAPLSLLRATKSRQRSDIGTDDRIRDIIADRIANHLSSMALIVELPVNVSDDVLFEMQKGLCAGCQAYLPFLCHQRSLFRPSGSPRKCSYTELLYCHKCHQMDNAILPSRVLHCWDFAKYPVSIGAKAYLYSIFPSPVLCINAVNPGLLAAVPVLAHLECLRKNIYRNMELIRAKGLEGKRIALSIEENAGCNKHLLQNDEFWSLKDLGDISRGVFARVPRWLEAVNKEIDAVVKMHTT